MNVLKNVIFGKLGGGLSVDSSLACRVESSWFEVLLWPVFFAQLFSRWLCCAFFGFHMHVLHVCLKKHLSQTYGPILSLAGLQKAVALMQPPLGTRLTKGGSKAVRSRKLD